jgi:hypothetical protein
VGGGGETPKTVIGEAGGFKAVPPFFSSSTRPCASKGLTRRPAGLDDHRAIEAVTGLRRTDQRRLCTQEGTFSTSHVM